MSLGTDLSHGPPAPAEQWPALEGLFGRVQHYR